MQGQGRRSSAQSTPLHEQLCSVDTYSLSTHASSLTIPDRLNKKKSLKVILKTPDSPDLNGFSPSLCQSPSHSWDPHSAPQLHHHQQLLLQQEHFHKQRLLQQQTQHLASELKLKLQQQHFLQQEHPKLLEQFKKQLLQEQTFPDHVLDFQSNYVSDRQAEDFSLLEQRMWAEARGTHEEEKAERRKISTSTRCYGTSGELAVEVLLDERFKAQNSMSQDEYGAIPSGPQPYQEQDQTMVRGYVQTESIVGLPQNASQAVIRGTKRQKQGQELEGRMDNSDALCNTIRSRAVHHQTSVPDRAGASSKLGAALDESKPQTGFADGIAIDPREQGSVPPAAHMDVHDAVLLETPRLSYNSFQEGTVLGDGTEAGSSKVSKGSSIASASGKKVLRRVLDKLQKIDTFGTFSEPVDAKEVPDYYEIIKEPMDFGTMRRRISVNHYTNLDLFKKDINAICNNAMTFNAAGTVYHRQARSIKAAAEKIINALEMRGFVDHCTILKQKTVGIPGVPTVRKFFNGSKAQSSNYATQPSVKVGGRSTGCKNGTSVARGYYVDWQTGMGQSSSKCILDDKHDATGCIARSLGVGDGRKVQLNGDSHSRNTYKGCNIIQHNPLISMVCGKDVQFVPAAFQHDMAYARSLARFAGDLGPDVWKIAAEKIRRAMPLGVPFGPGWVGQQEAPLVGPFHPC
ncbi:hypothetical protein KP509_23G034300 [Ceratopteris richardii]|uniref:Bromo domain-containing protein n=3 Tax=Ceratopteris richardii TaxID=49495 RepID=A0A8T2S1S9_CERRI|nr:hypothetical protein KP509_23G034300 [Ceratopteris richardii]